MLSDFLQHELEQALFRSPDTSAMTARIEALAAAHPEHARELRSWLDWKGQLVDHDAGPKVPTRIGHFQTCRVIGMGGMGIVYEAEQHEPVYRRVAIKVIRAGLDRTAADGRFAAEQQALARLQHPNIARFLEAGSTHDGRPFFVMELVRGLQIDRHCDEHRLALRERIGLVLQACAALQHAHDCGVLHRDVKPSNLLVTTVDGNPVVKVIDFGIAKPVVGRNREVEPWTETGLVVGTPDYMSPEQAGQSDATVDHRTDIYSLGLVLYELLVSVPPYATAARPGAAPLRLHDEDPPLPSERLSRLENGDAIAERRSCSRRELHAALRGGLDRVTTTAIARSPKYRYASCQTLADDLRRILAGNPPQTNGTSRMSAVGRRVRRVLARHRGLAGVLFGAAVAAWFGLASRSGEAPRPAPRAISATTAPETRHATTPPVLSRVDWRGEAPTTQLVARTQRRAHLIDVDAQGLDPATWMHRQQQANLAAGLGDVALHFVVFPDGTTATGRDTAVAAVDAHGIAVDAIAIGVAHQGEGAPNRAQLDRILALLLSLVEVGALDAEQPWHTNESVPSALASLAERFAHWRELRSGADRTGHALVLSRTTWAPDATLPASLPWMGEVTRICLHTEVTAERGEPSLASSAAQIRARYELDRERGGGDIGFHFLIDGAGRVFEGRSLARVGVHATPVHDPGNVGVCLLGEKSPGVAGIRLTSPQTEALRRLLEDLRRVHPMERSACVGHSELRGTGCPGPDVMAWLNDYRGGTKR